MKLNEENTSYISSKTTRFFNLSMRIKNVMFRNLSTYVGFISCLIYV